MAYKKLIKVSNVCQLLDKRKYPATQTVNGVTFTNNGDGSITANGTSTSGSGFRLDTFYIDGNRTYLMTGCPEGGGAGKYFMFDGYSKLGSDLGSGIIKTVSGSDRTLCSPILYIVSGQTVSNLVFKPQLFDLTEMYGAGHEPTTVEQFRQDFLEEMYDYSPHCWLTSYKRVIVTGNETNPTLTAYRRNLTCKTKNLFPYPYHDGTKTSNGVTFTDNGNGTINLSGTSTGQENFYFSYGTLNLKKGVTYTVSASGDYSCSGSFAFYIYNSTYGQVCYIPLASSNSVSFTPSQDINGINCYIVIPADRTVSGTLKPMLELGDTATDYVPYGHL